MERASFVSYNFEFFLADLKNGKHVFSSVLTLRNHENLTKISELTNIEVNLSDDAHKNTLSMDGFIGLTFKGFYDKRWESEQYVFDKRKKSK